ncbi:hypothetical protein HWV62_18008 [Athelia sp. TMB]|nr:hypothetical protein HWV62_18008 [Athelia sp. TMB]
MFGSRNISVAQALIRQGALILRWTVLATMFRLRKSKQRYAKIPTPPGSPMKGGLDECVAPLAINEAIVLRSSVSLTKHLAPSDLASGSFTFHAPAIATHHDDGSIETRLAIDEKTSILTGAENGLDQTYYARFVSELEDSGYSIICTRSSVAVALPKNPELDSTTAPAVVDPSPQKSLPVVSHRPHKLPHCEGGVPLDRGPVPSTYQPSESFVTAQNISETIWNETTASRDASFVGGCDPFSTDPLSLTPQKSTSSTSAMMNCPPLLAKVFPPVILTENPNTFLEQYQYPTDIEWSSFSTDLRAGMCAQDEEMRPRLTRNSSSPVLPTVKVPDEVRAIQRPEILYATPQAPHRPAYRRATSNPAPPCRNADGVMAAVRLMEESRARLLQESRKIQKCENLHTSILPYSAAYLRSHQPSHSQTQTILTLPSIKSWSAPQHVNLKRGMDFGHIEGQGLASNGAMPMRVTTEDSHGRFKRQRLWQDPTPSFDGLIRGVTRHMWQA